MHNKRHRNNGQKFIEEIHGKDIVGKGNTQSNSIGHGIEHEEYSLMLFLSHIFKGIQGS